MDYLSISNTQGISFLLLVILGVSVLITDLWKGNIYNFQTYSIVIIGMGLWFFHSGLHGVGTSLIGAAVGFGLLFPFYLWGGMGAGDLKYLTAIGALMGWYFAVVTLFYSALIGGGMAIALIIWKGCFWKTIRSTFSLMRRPTKVVESEPLYLPYGVAISLGSFLTLYMT